MRGRWIALGLAAILLLAIGVIIGGRTAEQTPSKARQAGAATVTVSAPDVNTSESGEPLEARPSAYARTPEGSVGAATAYVAALGGPVILDPIAVRATLMEIASFESRAGLARAYESAAEQARERLGVASGPVVVRTAPVGYRVDGFQPDAATVSIWRVGIVGGGATTEPRQSWRTETLSLVWEDDTWKIDALRSFPGPTPPLAGPAATPPTQLSAAIPSFEEYTRARP